MRLFKVSVRVPSSGFDLGILIGLSAVFRNEIVFENIHVLDGLDTNESE